MKNIKNEELEFNGVRMKNEIVEWITTLVYLNFLSTVKFI
jgi:hypothetical protein